MLDFLAFGALVAGAALLLALGGAVLCILKLVFHLALIPVKIVGLLLIGGFLLLVGLPLLLLGLPLLVLMLPVLVIGALVCLAACLLGGLLWLGFHALVFV